MPTRRAFLRRSLGAALAIGLTPAGLRDVLAATAPAAPSPYGPLGTPDAYGVRVPAGFTVRLVGQTGERVAGTDYTWHGAPDGGATFAAPDGGWAYASNCELGGSSGGVGVLRFDATGAVVDAYRILDGTRYNCAGGPTPWGTWLSCEEHPDGLVWECDPLQPGQGIARPALGRFVHEAAAVDPATGWIYLTEDTGDSRLYRFRPDVAERLASGTLEAAAVDRRGSVRWVPVSADGPHRGRGTAEFRRGEGAWFGRGHVYFSTTADHRIWALDTAGDRLEVVYDAATTGGAGPLRNPDNVTVHAPSGDLYVAEDGDDLQLVLLADHHGRRIATPFLQLADHDGSEITGPSFAPDGTRLYFSSQRGREGKGMTFEVAGPFRTGG
jgi:secreted PhoX family phosphatase